MRRLAPKFLILFALHCFICPAFADYYEDLGLTKGEDSTESEIKKAYRSLTKLYHPDHNPSEEAKEKYLKISRAYEVLADQKKRKIYDMKGDEGLKQLEDAQKAGGQQMHDPFAMFFGGGHQQQTKGTNMNVNMKVPLEDMYNGKTHTFSLKKQKLCRACKGTGAKDKGDMTRCSKCGGSGVVVQRVQLAPGFVQQVQHHCPVCGGKGKIIRKKCPVCGGQKVMRGETFLELLVEQGMPDGHQVTFEMEADESPDVIPGDVIVSVTSMPHSVFKRDGDNLHMIMKITLLESLVGFTKSFQHLDERTVEVKRSQITPHGHKMVMKGEGMPKHNVPSEMGTLTITFEVIFPTSITADQASQFRALLGNQG